MVTAIRFRAPSDRCVWTGITRVGRSFMRVLFLFVYVIPRRKFRPIVLCILSPALSPHSLERASSLQHTCAQSLTLQPRTNALSHHDGACPRDVLMENSAETFP
jgi:hypothetical protein